jgi:hypothetical protein
MGGAESDSDFPVWIYDIYLTFLSQTNGEESCGQEWVDKYSHAMRWVTYL